MGHHRKRAASGSGVLVTTWGLIGSDITVDASRLIAQHNADLNWSGMLGSVGKDSGSPFFENSFDAGTNSWMWCGIATADTPLDTGNAFPAIGDSFIYYGPTGRIYSVGGIQIGQGAAYAPGAIIKPVPDFDANTISFYKNGAIQGGGPFAITPGLTYFPYTAHRGTAQNTLDSTGWPI